MLSFVLSNWKTSLGGLTAALIVLCNVAGVPVPNEDALLGLILTWIGLASKDGNVTGGTVKQ